LIKFSPEQRKFNLLKKISSLEG